jgi:diguanylate cyclase (GGDEF)-like protein
VREWAARLDYTALSERMGYLLLLRIAIAAITLAWVVLRPASLGAPIGEVLATTAAFAAVSLAAEVVRRRSTRFAYGWLTAMLLADGLFLAYAMYATGGTQSPIRFLAYLHVVAVSLLVSYRTGLKVAIWHSLLLLVVVYAQAAQLLPPVDVLPGRSIEFDRMPVMNVTAFWLFALATAAFSALNERELRNRRGDLQALVEVGSRLDEVIDPVEQSRILLDGLVERFGFPRGVVLGSAEGQVVVMAAHGVASTPRRPLRADWIVRRAWERRQVLAPKQLDPVWDPMLAGILPGARNLLVAPMSAEGRTLGAIVVEHGSGRRPAIERRVAAVVGQLAAIAALNLRNAVLLDSVRDLAERDALTGAANRRMFESTLGGVLESRRADDPSQEQVTAVLFIDLDDFKIVNDSLGHAAGDALLVAVTERISDLVRGSDLVARLGGDEFAVLTTDEPDLKRSRAMAQRLVRELRAPYLIGGHHVTVSASIGIASAREAPEGASDLVRNADVAMYMAKANGKAGFAIYDPGMQDAVRARHELGTALQQAVELEQLRLVYQPIVALGSGRLAGVEALVRWQHPERGLIPPGQFIEIAEENGAILPIGRWVLEQACSQASRWTQAGKIPEGTFVCVNVSAREIQAPGFVDGVTAALAKGGLPGSVLILEITETALLKATPSTIATLDALRELGVRTVIDDFGTGYFSLSHLRQFPVDALKIASEFVTDTTVGSRAAALAGAIVALSESLGIETVAEGIETREQSERMRSLGCIYGQGFFFSEPLPAEDLAARIGPRLQISHEAPATSRRPARSNVTELRPVDRAPATGAA